MSRLRWRHLLLLGWLVPTWIVVDFYRCHRTGRPLHL